MKVSQVIEISGEVEKKLSATVMPLILRLMMEEEKGIKGREVRVSMETVELIPPWVIRLGVLFASLESELSSERLDEGRLDKIYTEINGIVYLNKKELIDRLMS